MQGACLCGAIEVTAPDRQHIDVCHCTMCRRWGGGPLLAVHCGADVRFSGREQPAIYKSSDWAERGFCPGCGTHLFYRLALNNEYALPVGLFAQGGSFDLHSQIFIDEKPEYYEFANDTPQLTGEQVFAQFSGAEG